MESKVKIIRPAGAFPANDDGWRQYEEQYADEMTISNSIFCNIGSPNPEFVKVRKLDKKYAVTIKQEIALFFDNYDELCIFGHAITDGINKLRDIDKEIEARQEMKILEDEEDGNN